MHVELAAPEFYKQSSEHIAARKWRVRELEAKLAAAYRRWEELEARSGRLSHKPEMRRPQLAFSLHNFATCGISTRRGQPIEAAVCTAML